MPIGLTEGAAIAAVTGVIITGLDKMSDFYSDESSFERLRRDLDLAARKNPRVVKVQSRYWFFHKDDFENRTTHPGGIPAPRHLNGKFNPKRKVVIKPNDGWGSNAWTVWRKREVLNQPKTVSKHNTLTNEECRNLFTEEYFKGGMVKRQLKGKDIIESLA